MAEPGIRWDEQDLQIYQKVVRKRPATFSTAACYSIPEGDATLFAPDDLKGNMEEQMIEKIRRHSSRTSWIVLAAALVFAFTVGGTAFSQTSTVVPAQPTPVAGAPTPHPIANFNRFLENHPRVARELAHNPKLIDNKRFVQNHPQLESFLKNHPEARRDFRQHPEKFMRAERKFDKRQDRRQQERQERKQRRQGW